MRLFREAGMTNAVRGETQVWTIETKTQAEAEAVWQDVRGRCIAELLHWNDGADRPGVCFTVDRIDIAVMKRVVKDFKNELKTKAGVR